MPSKEATCYAIAHELGAVFDKYGVTTFFWLARDPDNPDVTMEGNVGEAFWLMGAIATRQARELRHNAELSDGA